MYYYNGSSLIFKVSGDFQGGLFEHGVEGPADDEAADLAGTRSDLVELRVSQEPTQGVVVDVPIPTCEHMTTFRVAAMLEIDTVCFAPIRQCLQSRL